MTPINQPDWAIEFYADADGRCFVTEWLVSLPVREQAVVKRLLDLLQDFGLQLPTTYAKAIVGHRKLWELIAGDNRLFYFAFTGRTFVILHGFRKRGRKTPEREIAIAERRMAEFLDRMDKP